MTDPVSVAVGILVHAFLTGVGQGAGEAAGRDAYWTFRNALRRYPAAQEYIKRLEQDPRSPQLRDELTYILYHLGAERDTQLIHLAEQLGEALGRRSDVQDLQRASGFRSLQQILDDQLQRLMTIRDQYRVDDTGLLSSNISRATDVPSVVRAEARNLHQRIRQSIESTAQAIEGGHYRGADSYIADFPTLKMRERAISLVEADRALHVSHRALRLSIDYFKQFNDLILEGIEDTPQRNRRLYLMFANAVIVYELADYVIEFIEGFTPGGIQDLENLRQDALQRAEETRNDVQRYEEMANAEQTGKSARDAALKDASNTRDALAKLEEEWERYISAARKFYGGLDEVKGGLHNLRLIREGARIRIDVLEQAATLLTLQENLNSMQETVAEFADLKLAPLDAVRIERLLGP